MSTETPEYLVNYGKTGTLGRFQPSDEATFCRGDHVVLEGERGLTVGTILCQANARHRQLLGGIEPGKLLRRLDAQDQAHLKESRSLEQHVFQLGREIALELNLPIEILDAELSLDARHVIVQYLMGTDCDPVELTRRLSSQFGAEVWLENLAAEPDKEEHGGCGEPDCGRANGGSGCTTCGTGGGCTSCGSGKVDMTQYFAHLREQMESARMPLL